jgi:hypothetical protein
MGFMTTSNDMTLIEALRSTARLIKDGVEYSWSHCDRCNCGILARVITGASRDTVTDELLEIHMHRLFGMDKECTWSNTAQAYCSVTGLPESRILDTLFASGLAAQDIHDLENLSNEKIAAKVGRPLVKDNPLDVVDYLEAWATLLEDEANFGQCATDEAKADEIQVLPMGLASRVGSKRLTSTVHSFIAHPQPLFRIEFEQGKVRV